LESETTTELRLLEADRSDGEFRSLTGRRPGVRHALGQRGDDLFLVTNLGADGRRLLRAPVGATSPEDWEPVLVPEEGTTLEGVDVFASHLVVTERSEGLRRFRIRDLDTGEEHMIRFPEAVYSASLEENPRFRTRTLRLRYTSLVTPPSVMEYDMIERSWTTIKRTEVLGDFDPSRYVSERMSARSADGTAVPISLVYRRDGGDPGPRPCLLYAYGAYGRTVEPAFSPLWLTLLDRGFVYAIAHVRGGGELGEAWHDHGKLLHKRNTFLDFIAVAEHLVEEGYTTPSRLGVLGGSAGGLVVGAVLNERPDLFQAAVAISPFVDLVNTMLDPSIPLTVREYEEWGDPHDPEMFRYMLSYSPYDNVRRQPYPDLLVLASLEDRRVGYWEPAKWIARLRRHQAGDGRLLLRLDLSAGHTGASGRYDALHDRALVFAFLLNALDAETVR
ncbi:MAG: prolyl oligopeptidase family serine peptidase, partial [Acidobacteriota bacterium]